MTLTAEMTDTALLREQFCRVRQQTGDLCCPLSPEDMMVQSCPEASPAKWHLAHTTWFFETFLLREFLPGYRAFHPDFHWLFNSYYNAVSNQPEKKLRSSFSRPSLDAVLDYRHHVEASMLHLLETNLPDEAAQRVVLGMHHEQQHQELLATDIKHALWTNPLRPSYLDGDLSAAGRNAASDSLSWIEYEGGLANIGATGKEFAFDNEMPRHPEYLRPFRLCQRPVSGAEYLEFMEDGGYRKPEYWLAEGWANVKTEAWHAPLYWREHQGSWRVYTLRGDVALADLLSSPVCHVSYFEADAFAHWAGKRLPTEAEWEAAAQALPIEGNLLESGTLHPVATSPASKDVPAQIFGGVWEWTASPYIGYPGFQAANGALGEYNGKFMCNQLVLRGGSVVTPASHIRATYRNFFPPQTRWQFSGIRLAE